MVSSLTPILVELIQSAVRKGELLTGVNLLAPRVHTPQPSVKVALTDATQARTNSKSPTVTNHQDKNMPDPEKEENLGLEFWVTGGLGWRGAGNQG